MNLRRVILLVTMAALLVSVWAMPSSAAGSVLRIGLHSEESTLTPYSYVRGDPGYYLLLFVYDTLLMLNADNEPSPGLAEAYTWSSDGLVLTLDLRKGVKWHDGTPFTAADVVFTFEYALAQNHNRWTGPLKVIDKMEVANDHRLVLTLNKPSVGFIYQPLADLPIIPKHIWTGVADPRAFAGNIGTGPYKLVEYKADQYYRFEANKDYFMGAPAIDELVMPIIKDITALFAALKAGEVDAVSRQLSPELVTDFSAMSQMKVVTGPVTLTYMLLMNNQVPPFDNVEFRKAIYLAVDKQDMIDTLFLGYAAMGSPGWVHPSLPWYLAELDQKPRFDLEQAKGILDGLNYRDVNSDGYREHPDGRAMEFSLLAPSDDPVRVRAAELTVGYLKNVGVKVSVTTLDRATLFARIGWGVADHDYSKPRNFELLQWGWSAPMQSWPGRMKDIFHSDHENTGTSNLQASGNAELDQVLEAILTETDPAARTTLAHEAQRALAEDFPVVNLCHPDGVYVYNKDAYDGWVFMKGLGVFNKLSFLGDASGTPAAEEAQKTLVTLIIVAVLLVTGAVIVVLRRRAKAR